MTKAQVDISNITNQVKLASLDQFRIFTKSGEAELAPLDTSKLPYFQYLGHILVFGEDISINIKTHFMLEEAFFMCRRALNGIDITTRQALDFSKEFCNLVGGRTKDMFEKCGVQLGLSLPFVIQGYNEIFYSNDMSLRVQEAWQIALEDQQFGCSLTVAVKREDMLKPLADLLYEPLFGLEVDNIEMF